MRRTRNQVNQNPEFLELKNYILYFRVQELQSLLTFANANRNGKKLDLQTRALDLLKTRMEEVKHKVREIYQQAQSGTVTDGSTEGGQNPVVSTATQITTTTAVATSASTVPIISTTTIRNNVVVTQTVGTPALPMLSNRQQVVVAPTIAEHYGRHMAHPAPAIIYPRNTSGYPNCPDVRLRPLAFFDLLATLLRPSSLLPSSGNRNQEITFPLHLTPSQIQEISSHRYIGNLNENETLIQVQLRFCLMETSCEQEDYFPPGIQVRVNNKMVQLPPPIPTNKPGVEAKRPPRPVNITQYVRLSATVTNQIHIQWNTEYNRGFVAACYLVRKLSSSDLLSRLKLKGPKPAEYTRGLIKEKLKEDADCEVATTLLKVSLICPLGKMRMTTPCRASTCNHLQCFDASLYLLMNEKKPTWNCPVCDKQARFEFLVIDGYFQQVLESNFLTLADTEIQLHSDGSWSTHKGKVDTFSLDTPIKPNKKVEIEINDDFEVIAMDPPKTGIKIFNSSAMKSATKRRANETTVDLTISDSDDDDDIPLKRLMTKPSESQQPKDLSTESTNGAQKLSTQISGVSSNSFLSEISSLRVTPRTSSAEFDSNSSNENENTAASTIILDSPSPPSTPNPTVSSTTVTENNPTSESPPKSPVQQEVSQPSVITSTDTNDITSTTDAENISSNEIEPSQEDELILPESENVLLPAELNEHPADPAEHGISIDDDPLGGPFHLNVDFEKYLSPQKIPQIIPRASTSSSSSDDE